VLQGLPVYARCDDSQTGGRSRRFTCYAQDSTYKYFEIILVDIAHTAIRKVLSWLVASACWPARIFCAHQSMTAQRTLYLAAMLVGWCVPPNSARLSCRTRASTGLWTRYTSTASCAA